MSKKLLARIGLLVIVLFGVTILTFFYTNLSPVDAAEALAVRRYNRPDVYKRQLLRDPALLFLIRLRNKKSPFYIFLRV